MPPRGDPLAGAAHRVDPSSGASSAKQRTWPARARARPVCRGSGWGVRPIRERGRREAERETA
jgi:hypothetical protein